MPVFIARDPKGYPESVVLAKTRELANVYWQGLGVMAASITEHNEGDLIDHPTGVLPLVKTKVRTIRIDGGMPKECRMILK